MKAGVTYEQVVKAAEALKEEGKRPSQRNVIKYLGTGSATTVQKHLNRWEEGLVETAQKPKISLDDDMERAILLGIEKRVSAARAGLEADLADAIASRDDITAESEEKNTIIDKQNQQLDQVRAELQQKTGLIAELRSEIEARRDEVKKAQADARDQIEHAKADAQQTIATAKAEAQALVAQAEAETEQHRAAAEAARTALAKAELRLEGVPRLEAEIARLQAENRTLVQERQEAREKAVGAEARAEELAIYRGKAEAVEKELSEALKALAEAQKVAAVETERARMLERSGATAETYHTAQVDALRQRLEDDGARIKVLESRLDEALRAAAMNDESSKRQQSDRSVFPESKAGQPQA